MTIQKMNFRSACFFVFLAAAAFAEARISVPGSLAHSHTVGQGESFEGTIVVRNLGEERAEARIYQTDYSFSADGTSRYDSAGSHARSNAGWIAVSPAKVNLAPGEETSVYYSGTAPANLDQEGSLWSMIMLEPLTALAGEDVAQETEVSLGIRTVMRYGIQVVTHIGDSGSRELQILKRQLVRTNEGIALWLDVENTGARMLTPSVTADVFTSNGERWGKVEQPRLRIFPGSSVRYRLNLSELPAGEYSTMIVLDNGDDHVFGARYDLEIEP